MRPLVAAVAALALAASGWTAASLAAPASKMRHVPFVQGQLERQAVRTMVVAGFRVMVIRRRNHITPRGLVYLQKPSGGSLVPAGSLVRLRVSKGR